MDGKAGCVKKESQVESEMKKLSSAISSLEERMPSLSSILSRVLVSDIPPPTKTLSPDKLQETLCLLSSDIRDNASRVRQLTFQVKDILERIRL